MCDFCGKILILELTNYLPLVNFPIKDGYYGYCCKRKYSTIKWGDRNDLYGQVALEKERLPEF